MVNGLKARDDGKEVLVRLPVFPISGGTGNGFLKSLLFECNEKYTPTNAGTFVHLLPILHTTAIYVYE